MGFPASAPAKRRLVGWFFLVILTAFIVSPARAAGPAGPVDYSECVSRNKKFGGATAKCAEEICYWEVCKSNIIWQQSGTGVTSSPFGTKDPGAGGSALATCMPKQQLMQQCMDRELAAVKRQNQAKKEKPKPKKRLCKTGDDSMAPFLKSRIGKLQKDLKFLSRQRKKWAKRTKDHRAARDEAAKVLKPAFARMKAAIASAKGSPKDSPARRKLYEMRHSQWWRQILSVNNAYKEQHKLAKEAFQEWKRWDSGYKALFAYLDPAGRAANAGDCARATQMLKRPPPRY